MAKMKSKKDEKKSDKKIKKSVTTQQASKKTDKKSSSKIVAKAFAKPVSPRAAAKPEKKVAPAKESLVLKPAAAKAKTPSKPAKASPPKDDIDLGDDLDDSFGMDNDEIEGVEDVEIEIEAAEEEDEEDFDDVDDDTEIEAAPASEDIILTDAEGNRYCRARDCDQIAGVDAYCRYHYLLFWKKIQVRKKILADGKLERYVEELTSRYPDKFLEMIRRDLRTEKDFVAAIQELEIDESGLENDYEEDTQSFVDEIRGMGESAGDTVEDDF
jgi:hypothetical protein